MLPVPGGKVKYTQEKMFHVLPCTRSIGGLRPAEYCDVANTRSTSKYFRALRCIAGNAKRGRISSVGAAISASKCHNTQEALLGKIPAG